MASRVVLVPKEPIGGKQKNAPAKGRNRPVLREIGNLMHNSIPLAEGKFNPQISRPLTRRFCAQLLANGESQKHIAEVVPVPVHGFARGKAQKKPKVRTVDEDLTPDEDLTQESLTKKAKTTLSSILTTQNMMAEIRLTDRPSAPIINIDADDGDNELAAVEYVDEIYQFYKMAEDEKPLTDYMDKQTDINPKMRAILMDWLVEVHRKFELMPETLYLTISIIDRFLSTQIVSRRELQLVGITSMLIACKYEEIWAPEVNDFVSISDNAYDREQILKMEKTILTNLEWCLTVPTPYVFLVRYIKACVASDKQLEEMAFFLTELGVVNYSTVSYSPSIIAASAVYAACCTLGKTPHWTATLKHYTGYTYNQLMDCAKLLVSFHKGATENKLRAVYQKFSGPERGAVAHISPAKNLSAGT